MALVTCPFGHYYDNVKHTECPICAKQQVAASTGHDIQSQVTVSGYKFGSPTDGVTELLPDGEKQRFAFDTFDLDETYDAMSDENSTVGFFDLAGIGEYTAGWLVCVEGMNKGCSYTLRIGKNTIGRDGSCDVQLRDFKIIAKNHCSVVYEPKTNKFFIVPENGPVYFNDKFINKPYTLKNNDRINVGDSLLIFVPFCNKDRRWDP